MDNNALLLLAGAGKPRVTKQTIGEQGRIGFGGGIYGGDSSDLTAIGLSPLPNNNDPTNENYGSYKHTNGSVMLFIPAFCYRIGNSSAPSYSRDGNNALEIRDASLGEGNGWILHRAFIDGGQKKSGFFIDKYLCSKDSTGKSAISVKNGSPICTSTSYINSSAMPDCSGFIYDAITLSAARGSTYACVSAFQWSAIAMLSLAHGQAAKSTQECAWFDSNYQTNFPKGNNNNLRDIDDSSVTFTACRPEPASLTGSASNLAKTTHTGQIWGITDINGNKQQPLLGLMQQTGFRVAKESVKMHDFTKSNYTHDSLYESYISGCGLGKGKRFGNGENRVFFTDSSGPSRALCGVVPAANGCSSSGTTLFGNDNAYYYNENRRAVFASGSSSGGSYSGVWYRYGFSYGWDSEDYHTGFRAAGYAK